MKIQLPIKNFPAQQEIFDHPARYKIVTKGRRFGLTRGAANDFIKCALQGTFTQGLWVDTVNKNIDRYIERYFIPALRNLPDTIWRWRKIDKILEIKEAYVDFRSADNPENIEGFGYDKAFLNEAGIILKNSYLWHNAIQPMLLEFKPQTVIGGTPKGKGLFFELYMRGKDKAHKDYAAFHYTTFDNPYLDEKTIRDEIQRIPEMVRKQEYLAEFMDDSGVVFRGVDGVMTAIARKPEPNHLYVMGVDLAKIEDFTVIAVYDRKTNAQVYQKRMQQLEWPFQKKHIQEIAQHYNNALVILDATGLGDPIADDLIRAGVAVEPVKLTNQSKKELIEKLAIWIEQRIIRMLPIEESIIELKSFTYDVTASGNVRYNAPVGFHDDIVIAHALAISNLHHVYKEKTPKERTRLQEHFQRISTNRPFEEDYEEV